MKLYRYRLGIDSIIQKIDEVRLINDTLYSDNGEDYLVGLCSQSDLNSGLPVNQWENEWLCYNEKQDIKDVMFDLSNVYKTKLHSARKQVAELNARIERLDDDLATIQDCGIVED